MLQQAQQAEQQRLTLAEAQIEQRKNREIGKIRAETNRKISKLESNIRLWAVLLPPLPALCLGLFVFASRWQSEKRNVIDRRRRTQT